MPRQPPAAERTPSQRAAREERDAEAAEAEEQHQIEKLREELAQAQRHRQSAEKRAREAEEKLAEKDKRRKSKGKMSKGTFDRQAEAAATRWIEKYDPEDIPRLAMAIVGKAGKKLQKDLAPGIRKSQVFRKLRPQVYAERDVQIAKHIKEVVFPRKRSALLRLCCGFSLRSAHMISQSFKYERRKDGTKFRAKLAPDSAVPLPVPFELADIKAAEKEAEEVSKIVLHEHSDKRGCDIAGKQYALDTAIYQSIK